MTVSDEWVDLGIGFTNRFRELKSRLEYVTIPGHRAFGAISFLQQLLTQGHLACADLDVVEKIDERGRQRMAYIRDDEGVFTHFRLDRRLMEAFRRAGNDAGWDAARMERAIDSFLIHELLHFAQHMGFVRHSGLGRQSDMTLLALDYQADALSVGVQTQLAMLEDDPRSDWDIVAEAVSSVIDQMDVFTLLYLASLDREKLATRSFDLAKVLRTAIWHLQYHRCRAFNRAASISDLQLLAQPMMCFRSMEEAERRGRKIYRDWPLKEKSIDELRRAEAKEAGQEAEAFPPLIIAATAPYGTTGFARCELDLEQELMFFHAMWEADLSKSEPIFDKIFADYPWLVARGGGDDWKNGPGGPNNPVFPLDPGDMPETMPIYDSAMERAQAAFEPRIFPLVTFAVPEEEETGPVVYG